MNLKNGQWKQAGVPCYGHRVPAGQSVIHPPKVRTIFNFRQERV